MTFYTTSVISCGTSCGWKGGWVLASAVILTVGVAGECPTERNQEVGVGWSRLDISLALLLVE